MNSAQKNKVEGIFPLTYMQQGLLFHHLSSTHDQGFLNIHCTLNGDLNETLFEKACQLLVERHAVLRTSILWEKLEKPLQVVHKEKQINLEFLDWTGLTSEEKEKKWEELKTTTRAAGVDFKSGALMHIKLAAFEKNTFRLLWPSHHLLVDGWSSSILFKDLFTIYDALYKDALPNLEVLPSYKSYLHWVGKIQVDEAENFWKDYLTDLQKVPLFDPKRRTLDVSEPAVNRIKLSEAVSEQILAVARSYKVTLNTIIQGAWAVALGRYFVSDDVTYGAIVSGRSADVPNLGLMTGMFVNVQPVRSVLADEQSLSEWLENFQKRQQEALKYEHIGLDEITSFIKWPSAVPLFDSLLIFENYPRFDSPDMILRASKFQSGVTSTFPVTLAIMPRKELSLTLSVLTEIVPEKSATWLLDRLAEILGLMATGGMNTLQELKGAVEINTQPPVMPDILAKTSRKNNVNSLPSNKTEERLLKIWTQLFGNEVGITDDFFEIGGKSLLAVKMFSMINEEFDTKLPPTTLLEHKTIQAIAGVINGAEGNVTEDNYKNLVRIQPKGEKPPLFCLHAGGGHVFFYNPLARYMEAKRPIYALRPSGLYENERMHQSIEEMAKDYVEEIRKAHPTGPYHLLVYCFSTALGFEMANLMKKSGQEVNLIIADTMAEQENLTRSRLTMRMVGFARRFISNPYRVIKTMISDRVNRHLRPIWIKWVGTPEEKNTSKTTKHLVKVYNKYQWKPYELDVTLILTKKATELFNEELLTSWEKISGKVRVLHTEGDHRTLFEEPDVRFLAKTLDEHLS